MSNDKKYNGWKNYETWCVKLWIDNEEGSYNYWREQARRAVWDLPEKGDEDYEDERENAISHVADCLAAGHEEYIERLGLAGFAADLMNASLGEVDWHEIAESLIEDEEE